MKHNILTLDIKHHGKPKLLLTLWGLQCLSRV